MFGPLIETSRRRLLASLVVPHVCFVLRARPGSVTTWSRRSRPTAMSQVPTVVGSCRELKLALLGDVMLGRYVSDQFTAAERRRGAFGDVLPLLEQLDSKASLVAGNLECAVTNHPNPAPKAFNFKLALEHADVRQQLRLAYVSLANNHMLDYQLPGLLDTHKVLDKLGIAHSGSGRNLPEASSPAIIHCAGYKIAFLSLANHYDEWAAGPDTPGSNIVDPTSASSRQLVHQQVSAVQSTHHPDLLIVFVHWGPNWQWQPDSYIRQLGREMIEAGADVVFGHSAHHIQGVEFVDCKPIIYGAGGFIDDYATDAVYRNDLGCIWLAQFTAETSTAETLDLTFSSSDQQEAFDVIAAAETQSSMTLSTHIKALGCSTAAPTPATADIDIAVKQRDQVDAAQINRQRTAVTASAGDVVDTDTPKASGNAGAAVVAAHAQQTSSSSSSDPQHIASVNMLTAADQTAAVNSDRSKLKLHCLTAVPISIHHIWRDGQHQESGHGDPPYFSQVDLAHGSDYDWVANTLQHLCLDMGTVVVRVTDDSGVQLVVGRPE